MPLSILLFAGLQASDTRISLELLLLLLWTLLADVGFVIAICFVMLASRENSWTVNHDFANIFIQLQRA